MHRPADFGPEEDLRLRRRRQPIVAASPSSPPARTGARPSIVGCGSWAARPSAGISATSGSVCAITLRAEDEAIPRFLSGFPKSLAKNAVNRGARDTTIAPTATSHGRGSLDYGGGMAGGPFATPWRGEYAPRGEAAGRSLLTTCAPPGRVKRSRERMQRQKGGQSCEE
jgi:hypothetical protein